MHSVGDDVDGTLDDSSFAEWIREAQTADQISVITSRLPELTKRLADSAFSPTLAIIAGLMTTPAFHPNAPRLEALAHLICLHAVGNVSPTREDLHQWLNTHLKESIVSRMEDPVQDVFVSNVVTPKGNCRIFNGAWENPDFWVQEIVDILETTPETPHFRRLRNEVQALLSLSELLADRVGLQRYLISTGSPRAVIAIPEEAGLETETRKAVFTAQDLQGAGVEISSLEPFLFAEQTRSSLLHESIGNSSLERSPLLKSDRGLVFALPSAVSASIRRHVLERMGRLNQLTTFTDVLRKKQRQSLFREALRPGEVLPDESESLPKSTIDPKWLSEKAVAFDTGKIAHVVLLHDDLSEILEEGLQSFHRPPRSFQKKLAAHLSHCAESFAARSGYAGGLTVVVLGGLGRGFGLQVPQLPKGWGLAVWQLPDLIQLSWLEEHWLLKLWKLHNQVAALRQLGVRFEADTENVNLFACWRENHGRLIPLGFELGGQDMHVMLGPDFIASFRRAGRKFYDPHAVFKPDEQKWVLVRKKIARGYFKEVEAQPIYVSQSHVEQGILCGVVETSKRAWWLECRTDTGEPWKRDLLYKVWDAALSWLERLAPRLDDKLSHLPVGNFQVELDLNCLEDCPSSPDLLTGRDDGAPILASTSIHDKRMTLKINLAFFPLLAHPENDGERELVRTLVQASAKLARGGDRCDLEALIRDTIPDIHARFVHIFPAPSVRDKIAEFDPPDARFIQEEDFRFAALGAAWLVRPPGDVHRIEGTRDCLCFLNAVVDAVWKRIRDKLLRFDRRTLIEKCLRNAEGLKLDEDQWERTAQALLAVYRDRDDVIRAANNHQKERNQASMASRVLVEMAVCSCPPTGGKLVGDAEFDNLIANVILLISVAYESDAVHSLLTEPKIHISPNGEFSIPESFFDEVVQPYQYAFHSERFQSHAGDYSSLYVPQETGREPEELFDANFLAAFKQEYGIPLQRLARVDEVLQIYALEQRSIVLSMTTHQLLRLLTQQAGLTTFEAEAILRHFSLRPRQHWDRTPNGFQDKDWYPWRFRRRLSLIARPLVRLGISDDADLLYAPGFLHKAFGYTVEGAYFGRFDTGHFRTSAMRSWIGSINDRQGHDFNDQVAEEFRKRGFHALSSVGMATFTPPLELADLGDVDVLAWTEQGLVIVVECKHLRLAMTIGEIAEQLNRFRGEATDELGRHLRRYNWLREHPDMLGRGIGVRDKALSLRSLLVTNTVVPMQFKYDLPIPAREIVPFSQLEAVACSLMRP